MQTIDITSLSGHSPFNISICDMSYSNCSVVATGVISAPVTVTVPTLLQSSYNLILSVTDSIGCSYFEVISCYTSPTPTPTITSTPTPTPTNISCNCITFVNDTPASYGYGYTDCDGFSYVYKLDPYTTVYVCGKDPDVFGGPITYSVGSPCVANSCPFPSPTPSGTPTPTPTLPSIVGYFIDCCDASNEFIISDIPSSYYPLSGTYFIQVRGFVGCVTSVTSVSSPTIYSYFSMSTSFLTCDDCFKSNPFYVCPPALHYFEFTDCCSGTYHFYSSNPASYYGFIPGEVTQVYNQTGLPYVVSLKGCLTFVTESLTPFGGDILLDGVYSFTSPRTCLQCLTVNPYC